MSAFEAADAICRISEPLTWTDEKQRLMAAACREIATFHYEHSPELRFLYDRQGFRPETIAEEADIVRLPFLGVTAMKHYLLTSLPHEEAVLKITSSGTRGQKTQIWFDQASLDRIQATLDGLLGQEGLVSEEETNYLMFVYDPAQAGDLGIAFSCKNEQRFAPAHESFYAIQKNARGEWEFRKEQLLAVARRFARDGRPVRLNGIPSFIYEFMLGLEGQPPIELPQGSLMMTGGGWKAAEERKVSREEFRRKVSAFFGLPDERIRDGYGMAEHSAPYWECRLHRFHVPAFCRVIPRDPETLAPLPPGQAGLLELICPYNLMMPNLAVLSTDIGLVDPLPCGCGWNAPTFTLLGRGGLSKHKGCAITADEIVRRGA